MEVNERNGKVCTQKIRVRDKMDIKKNTEDKVVKFKYFKFSEFDCVKNGEILATGKDNMDIDFIKKLDLARELSGVPFKINSGFRTPEYNVYLASKGFKVAKNSPHLKGLAADISTKNSKTRYKVIEALIKAGFRRIGIGETFVHCDTDDTKSMDIIWTYY